MSSILPKFSEELGQYIASASDPVAKLFVFTHVFHLDSI